MEECHDHPGLARPFLFAAYRVDVLGELKPDKVRECPYSNETPCQIKFHHWRHRKTGPEHPLVVLRCRTHEHGFTVYPAGHVPYGRKAVAPVTEDGSLLHQARDEEAASTSPLLAWEQTLFVAALDAARGVAWPREVWPWSEPAAPGSAVRWGTQLRWMRRGEALLGLTAGIDLSAQEQLAWQLDIPCLALIAASQTLAQDRGYRSLGTAISRLLDQLPPRPRLVDDLVAAGYLAGLWGRPSQWDPGGANGGVLRPLFRDAGMPGTPRRGRAGSGSTTLTREAGSNRDRR